MSDRGPPVDYLGTCYREVARAIREVIPTLRHVRSREELESVAVCYERLAEHRDNVRLVDESAGEPPFPPLGALKALS
jgi:hypothetical protein